jgi:hypothetical protein
MAAERQVTREQNRTNGLWKANRDSRRFPNAGPFWWLKMLEGGIWRRLFSVMKIVVILESFHIVRLACFLSLCLPLHWWLAAFCTW